MVVAEALAAGTPVAASTATPWQCLEAEDAGWCFAPNASEIAGFLERLATISPQRLDRMGQRGRDLVVRDFSIDTIAGRFAELYKDLAS